MTQYELSSKGHHTDEHMNRGKQDIAAVHKREFDSLLELGMETTRVQHLLLTKYKVNIQLLQAVPTVRVIENRKAVVKKKIKKVED